MTRKDGRPLVTEHPVKPEDFIEYYDGPIPDGGTRCVFEFEPEDEFPWDSASKPENPRPIGRGFFCVYGRLPCLGSAGTALIAVGGVTIDPKVSSGDHHYPPARVVAVAHVPIMCL